MSQKELGIVKWFNDEKGFGFIAPDNGGIDIFAHYSEIQCDGHQTLKEGQHVSYIVGHGQKGPQATQITVL
ncbi:cold-shock protein [Acinetobacter modestus]|uniref:cold-shock protein n=1 Tax=Acinetobacter modestus TaxID=1776740 RepID=UPI001F4B32E3|nr:cold-shock protein [Acinetobacter modestus]MCH7334382.1 cold-shock protein [Acinetobacter modestus]MCH7388327.1 cold-shock protein [Acinetobacter modestus]